LLVVAFFSKYPSQQSSPSCDIFMQTPTHPKVLVLEEEVRRVWTKEFHKTPVCKDLPRLAGRIIIESPIPTVVTKHLSRRVSTLRISQLTEINDHAEDVDKIEVISTSGSPNSPPPMSKVWRQITKAILGVASNVETLERLAFIKEGLSNYNTAGGEMELTMAKIFDEVIGIDSNTAKVFKAIHQNVLFVGCFELKTKITMNTMTKDVRGPEGWRILITFGDRGTIMVTHYKREESLATAPKTDQFWFEWKIQITFDKDLSDVQATVLKVTNMGFGETTSETKKAEITKMLCAGNLLVS